MPCNCDHLEANQLELETSKVACLLDELSGKPIDKNCWDGYHSRVYNKCSRELANELTLKLCSKLKKVDVTKYSLEMQIWWRDHQEIDKSKLNNF